MPLRCTRNRRLGCWCSKSEGRRRSKLGQLSKGNNCGSSNLRQSRVRKLFKGQLNVLVAQVDTSGGKGCNWHSVTKKEDHILCSVLVQFRGQFLVQQSLSFLNPVAATLFHFRWFVFDGNNWEELKVNDTFWLCNYERTYRRHWTPAELMHRRLRIH